MEGREKPKLHQESDRGSGPDLYLRRSGPALPHADGNEQNLDRPLDRVARAGRVVAEFTVFQDRRLAYLDPGAVPRLLAAAESQDRAEEGCPGRHPGRLADGSPEVR